ncbi:molybdopterin converting factor subunit 1 [Brevibacillus humidisoli]|uniref:molybdopterin converting factor subunit 1 n=1 Tax=Brevibacillus humidisoli TaxID=2895522 RepID=UPI001E3E4A25|nr:molybdopterin converting factor subunit 1 [Brevibacillus humidisoli]UFJ42577.1 molybdopterin converting factor subunit 1 [Brevibacillus humidisoli]
MKVQVFLFAALAERTGQRQIDVSVAEPATVQSLLEAVSRSYPELSSLLDSCFVSVNQEYASPAHPVGPEDEVAILPPVSGGQELSESERKISSQKERFRITEHPISADSLIRLVSNPHAGAVLTFVGTVREYTQGQRTVSLTYEAYPPMAEAKMRQIAEEINQRWPGTEVAIHHRIGQLKIEEIAVVIAVAAPHRQESFEAGRYAIERLKQIVPIWKKEIWEDGSEWKGHQLGPWNPLAPSDPS